MTFVGSCHPDRWTFVEDELAVLAIIKYQLAERWT